MDEMPKKFAAPGAKLFIDGVEVAGVTDVVINHSDLIPDNFTPNSTFQAYVNKLFDHVIQGLMIPAKILDPEGGSFSGQPTREQWPCYSRFTDCQNCDDRQFWRLGHVVTFRTPPCCKCVDECFKQRIVIRVHYSLFRSEFIVVCRPIRS